MGFLNHLEREELFGGLRSLHVRALPAFLTVVLLYLSGDMTGLWAISWIALLPLCFACRGAGAVGAFILATVTFFVAGFAQSWWLLDVEGSQPVLIWLAFAVIPALPFLAIETPICLKFPWWTRPPLMLLLAVGCWAVLPPAAQLLIPLGGLINSEFMRVLYPKVTYATIAGLFTGVGWLAAELWWRGREHSGGRLAGWQAGVVVLLLLVLGVVDWTGVSFAPRKVSQNDPMDFFVAPGEDPNAQTLKIFSDGREGGLTLWRAIRVRDEDERQAWVTRAGQLSARYRTGLVIMLSGPERTTGYVFNAGTEPIAKQSWIGLPDEVKGPPLVIEGPGDLRLFPAPWSDNRFSTRWDYDLLVIVREPVHPAQVNWWLRECRRGAMIRGGRLLIVWNGGAAALDVDGQVVQRSDGEPMHARLTSGTVHGEAIGKARLTVVENILAMGAPVFVLLFALFTPLVFLKRRRRMATASVAIEEVFDDATTLSKEETERITRSIRPRD